MNRQSRIASINERRYPIVHAKEPEEPKPRIERNSLQARIESDLRYFALDCVRRAYNMIEQEGPYPVRVEPGWFRTTLSIGVKACKDLESRRHYGHLTDKQKESMEVVLETAYPRKPL